MSEKQLLQLTLDKPDALALQLSVVFADAFAAHMEQDPDAAMAHLDPEKVAAWTAEVRSIFMAARPYAGSLGAWNALGVRADKLHRHVFEWLAGAGT